MLKLFICIPLLFCQVIFAQKPEVVIFESSSGEVSFVSEAPLELIKASSDELRGLLRVDDRTFAFSIPTQSFKGFNSPLQQEHFYENYIESDIYPKATFQGKIIEKINLLEDGEHVVRAKGMLSIHGVEQERIIKVKLIAKNKKILASTSFEVKLDDHNIIIPKMVFHKIAEIIDVSVNLKLIRQNP
jgi:hypothetical protein